MIGLVELNQDEKKLLNGIEFPNDISKALDPFNKEPWVLVALEPMQIGDVLIESGVRGGIISGFCDLPDTGFWVEAGSVIHNTNIKGLTHISGDSIVVDSTLSDVNIDSSQVRSSTLTQSEVTHSDLTECNLIKQSTVKDSTMRRDTLRRSEVEATTASFSTLLDSDVVKSTLGNTRLSESRVVLSDVMHADVIRSGVSDSKVEVNSKIENSQISNSTIGKMSDILDSQVSGSRLKNVDLRTSIIHSENLKDGQYDNYGIVLSDADLSDLEDGLEL